MRRLFNFRFLSFWFLLSLCGLISCQNDELLSVTNSENGNEETFTVTWVDENGQPLDITKGGSRVVSFTGKGTYKTGQNVTLTASSATRITGSGDKGSTLSKNGTTAAIESIHENWTVTPYFDYWNVTVVNGTGGGEVAKGGSCSISANSAPNGQVWDKWTISGTGTLENAYSQTTKVTGVKTDCTVTANFKAVVTKNPSIVIWAEFTDGCADDVQTTMRSFRVMYRVIDGPTTVQKSYEVYGYYDGTSNQCYSSGPLKIPAGTNVTTNTQLWNSTAGFPAGISCGRMHIAVREL